ncbi:hypothetical protein NIES4073_83040 [Kalymmatonema gypsitolerans NIES-4073]|nr:hypothetical protein NIES4073_83040 [Scytonema sp. NIES-4073]
MYQIVNEKNAQIEQILSGYREQVTKCRVQGEKNLSPKL